MAKKKKVPSFPSTIYVMHDDEWDADEGFSLVLEDELPDWDKSTIFGRYRFQGAIKAKVNVAYEVVDG